MPCVKPTLDVLSTSASVPVKPALDFPSYPRSAAGISLQTEPSTGTPRMPEHRALFVRLASVLCASRFPRRGAGMTELRRERWSYGGNNGATTGTTELRREQRTVSESPTSAAWPGPCAARHRASAVLACAPGLVGRWSAVAVRCPATSACTSLQDRRFA